MELYIYNKKTMNHVAIVVGRDNNECEIIANDNYGDTDIYGWTYSPAFGFNGGLNDREYTEEIK